MPSIQPSVLPQVIPGQGKPLDLIILQSIQLPLLQQCNTTAMLCHGNSTLAVVVALVWAKGCILFWLCSCLYMEGKRAGRKAQRPVCSVSAGQQRLTKQPGSCM